MDRGLLLVIMARFRLFKQTETEVRFSGVTAGETDFTWTYSRVIGHWGRVRLMR
jgi:hypothetical protein